MDYFGLPQVPSYLPPEACFLDIPRASAAVPGSGDDLVVWTYSKDVGKFVARSLDLGAWPERSIIVGDRMNYKDLIRIVERVRGMCCYSHVQNQILKQKQVSNSTLHMTRWNR